MILFLTGFMGAGKTTFGKALAVELDVPFVDLDEYISEFEGESIKALFEKGEWYFREKEHSALERLSKATKELTVVALGGGTICHHENRALILQNGICVYLNKSWQDIEESLPDLTESRPILKEKDVSVIYRLWRQRQQFYRQSQLETLVNTEFSVKKLANCLQLFTNR